MHLLGHHLPDHKLLKIALTSFYGVSHHTSALLLARLQIPLATKVSELTEPQVTALSAFLSSPSTAPRPVATPLSTPGAGPSNAGAGTGKVQVAEVDPLDGLLIESDLLRKVQGDIAHLRQVGTYRGRRHALGYPVRGQNTRNNASTAKKLNRVDRKHFSSPKFFLAMVTKTLRPPTSKSTSTMVQSTPSTYVANQHVGDSIKSWHTFRPASAKQLQDTYFRLRDNPTSVSVKERDYFWSLYEATAELAVQLKQQSTPTGKTATSTSALEYQNTGAPTLTLAQISDSPDPLTTMCSAGRLNWVRLLYGSTELPADSGSRRLPDMLGDDYADNAPSKEEHARLTLRAKELIAVSLASTWGLGSHVNFQRAVDGTMGRFGPALRALIQEQERQIVGPESEYKIPERLRKDLE